MSRRWLLLSLAAALGGCAQSEVVLLQGADRRAAAEVIRQGEPLLLVHPGQGLRLQDGQHLSVVPERLPASSRAALAALPEAPQRFQLYLEDDGTLSEGSRTVFEQVLAAVRQRAPAVVRVTGHTDTLGDAAINAQIGLRRARQVADRLTQAGNDVLRLQVASHGEADLLVPTPDATREPLNRRVEVSVQ